MLGSRFQSKVPWLIRLSCFPCPEPAAAAAVPPQSSAGHTPAASVCHRDTRTQGQQGSAERKSKSQQELPSLRGTASHPQTTQLLWHCDHRKKGMLEAWHRQGEELSDRHQKCFGEAKPGLQRAKWEATLRGGHKSCTRK